MIDLSGKKVLVTGAGRGIGRAIAELLGELGAIVAVHGNKSKKQVEEVREKIGSNAHPFIADLSDLAQVKRLYTEAASTLGGLDVLINNAGIAINSDISLPDDQWLAHWQKTQQVNLTAMAYLCKLAVPHFIKNSSGIIINISSRAAFRGDTAEYMAYAASKGGVVALTKSIARAYGKKGITAFSIAPGFTKTDMARDFVDAYGEDYILNDLSLDELTLPTHVAPTAAFLASGLATHATGSTIDINAGSYVR